MFASKYMLTNHLQSRIFFKHIIFASNYNRQVPIDNHSNSFASTPYNIENLMHLSGATYV